MEIKCEIKEIKENYTLAVRTRTPVEGLPQAIGNAYGGIMQYLGELNEQPIGMPFAKSEKGNPYRQYALHSLRPIQTKEEIKWLAHQPMS